MCRLAAFPPGFPPNYAIKILARFAPGNDDGTGSVHVKDGKFVVNKWALPLNQVIGRNYPLLAHMPYDGWTVCHLRAASHGGNSYENTHPFLKGDWAVVHNGIWSEYDLVKAALKHYVKFDGETDSEVAAQLLATVGPKQFGKLVSYGGVYLSLNKNGELWSVKTSGVLEMLETKYGQLLASTLPDSLHADSQDEGWMRFGTDGELIDGREFKKSYKRTMFSGSQCSSPSSPVTPTPRGPIMLGSSMSPTVVSRQTPTHSPVTPVRDW